MKHTKTFNPRIWDNYSAEEHVSTVVKRIVDAQIDITADYYDWLSIGFALASDLGEGGRDMFHDVSQFYPGYSYTQCDSKYDECLRSGRGDVHIASFMHIAKQYGVDITPETSSSNSGSAKTLIDKIIEKLKQEGKFRNNVIKDCCEWKPVGCDSWIRIDDYTVNSLWRQFCSEGVKINPSHLWNIINSDFSPRFNPIEAYLSSLPEWHEGDTDYIAEFASMVDCDDHEQFVRDFRKWFVSMVAMWKGRGINQQILVLVGPQGKYKSSWLRAIVPPVLSDYVYTKADSAQMTKDDRMNIAQCALMNLEELDTMTSQELNQLKAISTMESINERPAYGHVKIFKRRIASLCGSGNNEQFLTDQTGNRRWLVYKIHSIESPFNRTLPHEGMYAQALALIESGFDYYFSGSDIQHINQRNRSFEAPDAAMELVSTHMRKPMEGETARFMSPSEIIEEFGWNKYGIKPVAVGKALTRLGYKRRKARNVFGYDIVLIDSDKLRNAQELSVAENVMVTNGKSV